MKKKKISLLYSGTSIDTDFIILFKVGFLISFSLYYCYPSQMTSSAIFPWQALNRAKMRDYSIKHRLRRGRHSNEVWLMLVVQWKKQKMATKGSRIMIWISIHLGTKEKKRWEEADYYHSYYFKTNIDYSFKNVCYYVKDSLESDHHSTTPLLPSSKSSLGERELKSLVRCTFVPTFVGPVLMNRS